MCLLTLSCPGQLPHIRPGTRGQYVRCRVPPFSKSQVVKTCTPLGVSFFAALCVRRRRTAAITLSVMLSTMSPHVAKVSPSPHFSFYVACFILVQLRAHDNGVYARRSQYLRPIGFLCRPLVFCFCGKLDHTWYKISGDSTLRTSNRRLPYSPPCHCRSMIPPFTNCNHRNSVPVSVNSTQVIGPRVLASLWRVPAS